MPHAPKIAALALTAALAGAAAVPAASSATATKPGRHTVTAKELNVYQQPTKLYKGVLLKGETFVVKKLSRSGKYAYGFAFGHVNKTGWVTAASLDPKQH